MAIPIQLRRNGTAASTPSSLLHGEVALNYADGKIFWKDASNVIQSFTFQAYALSSHTHAASDITSGTLDAARLPLATTGAAGAVIVGTGLGVSSGTVSVTYGTIAGTACQGNDSRLSDQRTPTNGSVTSEKIADANVTFAKLQSATGASVIGRSANSAGVYAEIVAGTDGHVLRRSGTTVGFGTIATAGIADDAVTYAKLQNVSATDRLLGRSSAGAGDVEEVTCTAFGRSLIDDADAAAARSTLSVQPTASPAFTGNATFSGEILQGNGSTQTVPGASSVQAYNATSGGSAGIWAVGASGGGQGAIGCYDRSTGSVGAYLFSTNGYAGIATINNAGGFTGNPLNFTASSVSAAAQLLVTAGSASAPGVAVSGDANTGLYSPGADQLALSTNQTERLLIDASGNIRINGAAAATSAVGAIHLKNGTAPTASITDGVILFAADVTTSELRVRDEAGNTTTLSPHAFPLIPDGPSEPMAWAYYSERDGRRINVDMLRVVRLLEQLTGEKLVYED